MNRKQIGDIGEAMAIAYYTKQGYDVSVPLGSPRYDLIVDDGLLKRVQVKTSGSQKTKNGVPVVTLSTQGGNRSWEGTIKYISEDETDSVFVYSLETGEMWDFPVAVCAGKRRLNLGKLQEKYKVTLN